MFFSSRERPYEKGKMQRINNDKERGQGSGVRGRRSEVGGQWAGVKGQVVGGRPDNCIHLKRERTKLKGRIDD